MKNMYLETHIPPSLYYSTVKQARPASSSTYQKKTSSQLHNQFKIANHVPPSFLNNHRKQDYKFNVVISPAQRIEYQAGNYKGDNFAKNNPYSQSHQSRSANKYEDHSSHQNATNSGNLQKVSHLDPKEVMAQRPRRSSESNSNINHIMQKLHKKEQLIKELQKICDNKVSDHIRKSSQDKHKIEDWVASNSSKYSGPSSKVDKVLGSQNLRPTMDVPGSPSFDLTLSTVSSRNKKDANFSYLKEFETNTKIARKQPETAPIHKNPEENYVIGAQRVQYPNYSPREYKAQNLQLKTKQRLKMQMDKVSSNMQIPFFDQPQKYSSSKNNTYNSFNYIQISSPTLKYDSENKSKVQESYRDRKNAKDIRNIIQTRNLQKKSSYFANKKLSINDFDLKKTLGEGKFGVVYQAFHTQTKTLYALKKISKKVIKSNLMVDQLLQEIKIQFFCSHQNILKIYGFFDDSQFIYLILEYMEQGTLFSVLKKEKKLTEKEAAIKLKQIAKGIAYLQENGIVHRDIKPENIVMSNGVGKLCDFGWAAICTDRRKTYCGTFDYVAPEILEGNQYDITVDLWCLGVMAYELMVGKAPFYHISRKETMKKIMNVQKTALEFPSHLSKNAVSFIDSLVKKNPQQRLNGQDILKHPFLSQIHQPSY